MLKLTKPIRASFGNIALSVPPGWKKPESEFVKLHDGDMSKRFLILAKILFVIILANFIAQVPYAIHLYGPGRLFTITIWTILMGVVFALFLIGFILFVKRVRVGYWLLMLFLSLEFLFYIWNLVGSIVHGFPLFFQLFNPDPLLRIVFAVGYLNLFASGYFLFLLLFHKPDFQFQS